MPRHIDIGGAPAHAECAQLGQTEDFDSVNRLEVRLYEAALIARFGLPPGGCAFEARENRHDFGVYWTLALQIDDEADKAVTAYAAAVSEGLGYWTEAGFAPPIQYALGGGSTTFGGSFDDIIRGAMMTTRPSDDGRFSVPEFATLHGNLKAAYPAIAATLDISDPGAQARQAFARAKAPILAIMAEAGIVHIGIDYDGGGDEGQVHECRATDAAGVQVDLPTVDCESVTLSYRGEILSEIVRFEDALDAFASTALEALHDGWENGEGAYGTVEIDAHMAEATLTHNVRVITADTSITSL